MISIEWTSLDLVGYPDPKTFMGKRQESECQHYREQLVKDQERLADLEARGDVACSDYDLRMGYNAEFNKQLKRNHIIYDLKQLIVRLGLPIQTLQQLVPDLPAPYTIPMGIT